MLGCNSFVRTETLKNIHKKEKKLKNFVNIHLDFISIIIMAKKLLIGTL